MSQITLYSPHLLKLFVTYLMCVSNSIALGCEYMSSANNFWHAKILMELLPILAPLMNVWNEIFDRLYNNQENAL